jgi:hypothetical protein
MPRNIEPVVTNDRGDETHPAFALISASRTSTSPGSVLFDSDIRHQHSVVVRISTATRKRSLNQDRTHEEKQLIEIEMSEAQWGSFVSSMNVGSGVPCTLRAERGAKVPGLKYEPRMAESLREVQEATGRVFGRIDSALSAYESHKTVANLRALRNAVERVGGDLDFAAKSLAEYAEGVVQRARADVEVFVANKARQLGLDPADVQSPLELEAPETSVQP